MCLLNVNSVFIRTELICKHLTDPSDQRHGNDKWLATVKYLMPKTSDIKKCEDYLSFIWTLMKLLLMSHITHKHQLLGLGHRINIHPINDEE